MKHFIGAGVLISLALAVGFILMLGLGNLGVAIHVHDTYWVIPPRKIALCLLIGMTTVGLLVVAYKLVRRR